MNNEQEKSESNEDKDLLNSAKEIEFVQEEVDHEKDETQSQPSSATRRNVIIGIVTGAALLSIVYFFFWRNGANPAEEAKTEEPDVTVSVKTVKVKRDTLAQEFSTVGTISPVQQSTVSAALGAQIKQMPLLKNQFVRQGDVIAVLYSQDLQAQRAEAQAALQEAELNRNTIVKVSAPQGSAQAEKDLSDAKAAVDNARVLSERRKDLYQKGGIALKDVEATQLALTNAENNLRLVQKSTTIRVSAANPNDVSIAEAKIAQANNRLKTIDAQLAQTIIRAPLSGVVTDQFQFAGEYAAQGARLVNIANINEVVVKANFADTIVANLKVNDAVKVLPNDLAGEEMNGKVTNIARSSDAQNRTVEVWVSLGNGAGRLRLGSAAQIVVSSNETSDAVVVPVSAVTLDASNSAAGTVMIVGKDGLAHETKVTVGIRSADKIQIVEGLDGNEDVIVEGNFSLPDGTKVEATEINADENKDPEDKGGAKKEK